MENSAAERKNWFRRHKLLTGAVIVLLLALAWEARGIHYSSEKPALTPQASVSPVAKASPGAGAGASSGSGAKATSSPTATIPASEGGSGGSSGSTVPAYRMTIANSTVTTDGTTTSVVGQITNNEDTIHSANVQATFYDKSGAVLGTAKGSVSAVSPHTTKTFTLSTTQKVSGYDKMVVEVNSIS